MVLRDYLARMDGQDPNKALELMESDLRFHIALPGNTVQGRSKDDFAAYILGRNAVDRIHEVIRSAVDGDTEMIYGAVVESGRRVGLFMSTAVVSPAGLMAGYQSYFTTSFDLFGSAV